MTNRITFGVKIADIKVNKRLRGVGPAAVTALAESMHRLGQLQPILLCHSGSTYVLVAGLHRLEAAKRLEWDNIEAVFVTGDKIDLELQEIAENLHRAELSKLERDDNIAEWIRITEGVSRQVDAKPQGGRPEGGVRAAARELGIDEVDARRAVKVAAMAPEAKEAARAAGLDDNRSALLEAAKKKTPAAQLNVIKGIAAAKQDTSKKKKSRKPRFVAPKSTPEQHDEFDLESLQALWGNSGDNARAAFLESVRSEPARGSAAICNRVREAIINLAGLPPAHEVAGYFANTDAAITISEHTRPAAAWLAEFSSAWRDDE